MLTFDTDLIFVIGRTQLLGPEDIPTLSEVMAGSKYSLYLPIAAKVAYLPRRFNGELGMMRLRVISALSATSTSCYRFASQHIHPKWM